MSISESILKILIDATGAKSSLDDLNRKLDETKKTAESIGTGGAGGLNNMVGDVKNAEQAFNNLAGAMNNPIAAAGSLEGAMAALVNPITAVATAITAITVGGFKMADAAIDAADKLHTLQMQTGLTVEQLQTMKYVAEDAGANFDALSTTVEKFAKNAVKNNKDFADSMQWLGVSMTDANGKMKDQYVVMQEVAVALSQTAESANKHAAAQAILGKSYKEAMPALLELNSAQEKQNFLNETGAMQSQQMADAADNLNDTWAALGKVWDGMGNQLAEVLLPLLQGLASSLLNSATETGTLRIAIEAIKIVFEGVIIVLKGALLAVQAFDLGMQLIAKTVVATGQTIKAVATGDFGSISGIWSKYADDVTRAAQKQHDAMATIINGYDGMKTASAATQPVIQREGQIHADAAEHKKKHKEAIDQVAKATENARDKLNDYLAKLQDEYNTIGMSKTQREQYNEIRKIENMMMEKNVNLSEQEKKAYIESALALQEKIAAAKLAQEQQEKTMKATADAVNSINDYIDGLHREAEAAGMSSDEAEKYNAVQKATAILRKENVDLTEEQIVAYQKQIEVEIQLKQENIKRIKEQEEARKKAEEEARDQYKKSENAFQYMLDQATPALEKFFNLHKGTIGKVVEVFKGLGITLKDILGPETYDALINMTTDFRKSLIDLMHNIFTSITSEGSSFMKGLVEIGKNALSWLADQAGNILDGIGSAIGSIFGGGGEDGGGSFLGGVLGAVTSFFGFADGGQVDGNRPIIVGERGPELFVPSTAGAIIPNNVSFDRNTGVGPIYFNFNVNGVPTNLALDTNFLTEFATNILQQTQIQLIDDTIATAFGF